MPSVTETAPWRSMPETAATAPAASPQPPAAQPLGTTPVAAASVASTAVTPPQPPADARVASPQPPAAQALTPLGPPVTPMAPPTHAVAPPAPVAHAPPPPAPVVHAPPPVAPAAVVHAPVAPPVLSRAPLAAQNAEPHEDARALVRAAVGEALAPVQQAFREIQRRLDDLERRPLVVAPAPAAAAGPTATLAAAAMRPPQATYPGGVAVAGNELPASVVPVSIAPIPITVGSIAPRPPVLDIAAIERDRNVSIDGAIDGRRRKLKIAITFTLLLLAVFGGLFAALAYSYAPHSSGMLEPTSRAAALASTAPVARPGTGPVA